MSSNNVQSISAGKAPRQSNIELLRIVLMLMIITHHVIVHGLGLKNIGRSSYDINESTYVQLFINSFVVVGVNAFVFISGYFGMKFKFRTVVSFVLQALFYSVTLFLISNFVNNTPWDEDKFWLSLQPISTFSWWFLTTYLGLYFISPLINKGFEAIDRNQGLLLLAGLLFLDCYSGFKYGTLSGRGYSIFHFVTLYVLARFISKYIRNIRKAPLLLIISTLILFATTLSPFWHHRFRDVWLQFSYNNPLLNISAILLFFSFRNLTFQSKLVNVTSGAVFGVYLLHEHHFIKKNMIRYVQILQDEYSGAVFVGSILLIIVSIFVFGVIIELGRKQIFDWMMNRFEVFWQNNPRIHIFNNRLGAKLSRLGGLIEYK